jgi:hypothetical protein
MDLPDTTTVVAVDEEYGYRHWLWAFPGDDDALAQAWRSGHAPTNFWDPSVGNYPGTMTEVYLDDDDLMAVWDEAETSGRFAHVHEPEDTFLSLHGDPVG